MKILCYGDSNTWGYVPNVDGYSKDAVMRKYEAQDCWWYPLMRDNEVVVDGLCGRCIAHENKWLKNRNASLTIVDDIKNYNDLDLIIIQLGTNDCKSEYGDSADNICDNLEQLLACIKGQTNAEIIIISPSCIREDTKITQKYYIGALEKSRALDKGYQELAEKTGCGFVSGVKLEVGEDGEHLTKSGHQKLGEMVASFVMEKYSSIYYVK